MARIIIVDDDEIVAEIVIETLGAAGHIVSAVHDGDAAMTAIAAGEPDLLILDYGLPGRSGMAILRDFRALPHAANVPILMLTANRGRLLRVRAEQTGADDYIVKPFDPVDLVARVEALLASGATARSLATAASDLAV